jgi:hypothetical protein
VTVPREEEKLKLGKGAAFVKGRLKRLRQEDETWEVDFRALPKPIAQSQTHYRGMVVAPAGFLLADSHVEGRPTVNDMATLLAHAMRRPLTGKAHRPRRLHVRGHPQWRELFPHLGELGVKAAVHRELPKVQRAYRGYLRQQRDAHRVGMVKPTAEQQGVEELFPAVTRYVRGYGHIEIGDQEMFGFVARALDYGGLVFEDDKPDTLAEALAALEKGLTAYFEREGIEVEYLRGDDVSADRAMLKELKIADIVVGDRHRRDMGDLTTLADSIRQEGLLQPIGVTDRLELVFGERRIRAVRDILKKKTILARVVDVSSIVAGEYHENEIRKDFTPSERVAIARAIERQVGNRRGQRVQKIAQVEPGRKTRDAAAERAGFGNHETYRQAAKVVESGTSRLIRAMDGGRVSISAAALLADADPDEQDRILDLDEKAILQAAQEIRRRRADGISGHEQPYKGETNDWLTPRYILDALGKFDLDPCAALDRP